MLKQIRRQTEPQLSLIPDLFCALISLGTTTSAESLIICCQSFLTQHLEWNVQRLTQNMRGVKSIEPSRGVISWLWLPWIAPSKAPISHSTSWSRDAWQRCMQAATNNKQLEKRSPNQCIQCVLSTILPNVGKLHYSALSDLAAANRGGPLRPDMKYSDFTSGPIINPIRRAPNSSGRPPCYSSHRLSWPPHACRCDNTELCLETTHELANAPIQRGGRVLFESLIKRNSLSK